MSEPVVEVGVDKVAERAQKKCNACRRNDGVDGVCIRCGSDQLALADARAEAAEAELAALRERIEALIAELDDLADHDWINLENSTDRFLAQNYRLVVTVDDLRDVINQHRVTPPAKSAEAAEETGATP